MISIQNVTFFHKKNMILIARGMKKTWLSYTQGGNLVVKMKGFDRYWYDPDTGEVFSRKSARVYEPIKKQNDELKTYFYLYLNGQRTKVYHWEILRDNMSGIEIFVKDRMGEKFHLTLVS